jgi:hypothetical protein
MQMRTNVLRQSFVVDSLHAGKSSEKEGIIRKKEAVIEIRG